MLTRKKLRHDTNKMFLKIKNCPLPTYNNIIIYAYWSALNETEWPVLRRGRSAHKECGQNNWLGLGLVWSWRGGNKRHSC
jgi:hypothetical protein